MRMRHHQILVCAILAALAVAIGYAFLLIPNVEFITATIFISGVLTSRSQGFLIGVVAEFFFSFFNPYGTPAPPLLAAQIIAMGWTGFVGGSVGRLSWLQKSPLYSALSFGAIGLFLTLIYDVLTNLSIGLMLTDGSLEKIASILFAGISFSFLHILTNTLGFALVAPVLLRRLWKMQKRTDKSWNKRSEVV